MLPCSGQAQVLISEFVAINSRSLADEEPLYEDWIEIGNFGSVNVEYVFPPNEWHHLTAVGTEQELRVYFDGELAGTGSVGGTGFGDSDHDFNVGGGGVFDNVLFSLHGQSSRGFPKKSYNLDFPWDVDLSWGRNWVDSGGYFTDRLYQDNVLDFYNSSQQRKGDNRLYELIFDAPDFRAMDRIVSVAPTLGSGRSAYYRLLIPSGQPAD